jgi:hypothetical protein
MDRQEHYFGGKGGLAQPMGGIDSTQNWHRNIGHNYVRAKAESLRD